MPGANKLESKGGVAVADERARLLPVAAEIHGQEVDRVHMYGRQVIEGADDALGLVACVVAAEQESVDDQSERGAGMRE